MKVTTEEKHSDAYEVVHDVHGDPRQVLRHRSHPLPLPLQDDQVLVQMKLAPVNPSDINMIEGTYFIRPPLPAVVGNEGVGEVLEVGAAVKDLQVGDWVLPGYSGWGTWRSHAVCGQGEVTRIANDIPALAAATFSVNPCTAYRLLKDFADLSPGDIVLQNSANSAVGQAVCQLGREWGLVTVNVVRDRPDLPALTSRLQALGATHVITEEFLRSPDMKPFLKSLQAGPPKLALNGVGGKSATELLRLLGQGGAMVTYGGMSRKPVTVPTGALIFKEVRVLGYWNTEWNKRNAGSAAKAAMVEDLCQLMRTGRFEPPPAQLFPLDQYQPAVETAVEGFREKKVVLSMTE